MNITIEKQHDNALLKRKEVTAKVIFEGNTTPSRTDIQKAIAKKADDKPELVMVQQILTQFGNASAKIFAHIYADEESLKILERKNLVEKHEGHQPAPAQED
jgi:ribosomal protein S24E